MTPSAARAGRAPVEDGLVIEEVSVRFDGEPVLDRLSLTVAPGEVVAVVGPSGSGKSTLLRAVAGLEPLAGGRIVLGGRDLGGVPTHHRGLGLMFQDHGLFTHLDVAGNVAYGLRVAGMSDRERGRRVAELVALVGLDGLEGRRVDQLSGGEAQRVALARALAPEPGLLMLDEPLGSLDRALREQLTGELRRLLSELGQTALHVTHDQSEAFAMADRVAVIDDGRVVAVGRPADLWSDPGSRFVASFLGHPNLWSVTVDDRGAVWADGLRLGRLAAGHELSADRVSGDHRPVDVVVPVTAIDMVAQPDEGIVVEVERVVFDRGTHRVAARLLADGSGDGAARTDLGPASPVTVEFDRTEPIEVGARCRIRLDLDQVRVLHRP